MLTKKSETCLGYNEKDNLLGGGYRFQGAFWNSVLSTREVDSRIEFPHIGENNDYFFSHQTDITSLLYDKHLKFLVPVECEKFSKFG